MGRVPLIAAVTCLSLASAAQQPQPPDTRQAGLAMLAQARESAASAAPFFRPDVLDEIAIAEYEVGEKSVAADVLRQALTAFQERLAQRRNLPQRQTSAHSGSGSGLAECGSLAARFAQRHFAVNDRSGAQQWLTAASDIFPQLYDEHERIHLGLSIYKIQIALGELDGARKTVAAAYPPDRPDFTAFGDIAAQLARDGNLAAARAMAAKQPDVGASQILSKVAIAQAESKDFAGALETAALIRQPYLRVDTVAAIGEEESKAGDKTGALVTFTTALQLQPRGSAVPISIVLAEARSGFLDNAMQLLAAGTNLQPQSAAYLDVAVIAAGAKRPDIAKECFAAALAFIQKQPESEQQLQLQNLVRAQAQARDFGGALQTTEMLSGQFKDFALAAISSAQADVGDVPAANQTLAATSQRQMPSAAVIEANARAGNFMEAFNAARPSGSHELEKVFHAYCKPDTMAACLQAVSDLTFPERRAGALLGIAESLLGIDPTPMPGSSRDVLYPIPSRY